MITLDMINKVGTKIDKKQFHLENNILTLEFDCGAYDLTDKIITAIFSLSGIETEPLQVVEGIIKLPIYANYVDYGINYIQLNFRWGTSSREQGPEVMWKIDKSLEANEVGQEQVDIITYLIAQYNEIQADYQSAEAGRDDLYTSAELARDVLYQSAEAGREDLYVQAEAGRDDLYTSAELARDVLYQSAEAGREDLYVQAEAGRDDLYTSAELARDVLYQSAEAGREDLYVQAEAGREDLYVQAEAGRDDLYTSAELARDSIVNSLTEQINDLESELDAIVVNVQSNKNLPHYDHVKQEYVNLDKMFNALRNGKVYTTEFNQYATSPSSLGTKKDDNVGLICEPSTNIAKGQNDYENIGLFSSLDVNAYVDTNDNYHVIAIKGDGIFKNDGTMGDVYVMSMVGYYKWYSNETVWGISYSNTLHAGFDVLDEAVKPDGTIRPFLLHAKYVAGRNPYEGNNLASISGVYPEFVNMSHNGQITEFKAKGVQYSGKTSHDDYYVQIMMWIKYAIYNSDSIMKGCQSYYFQYKNLVAETGVNRVIITNSQASNLVIGSTVSIGDYTTGIINADRQLTQNYNKANRVNIVSIVDLGNGNSAVYINSSNFDTTLTTTITTYPWNSGGCDSVLGQDGSPYNNLSGKEPFIINGIEMMVGGYEILQNLIIVNNSVDNRIDVYANYDCMTYTTSITDDYDLVGQLAQTNNTWQYGSKMTIAQNHPSVILVTETNASSTTGTGDGIYTNPPSVGGTRGWRSLGDLSLGSVCGLRCLSASGGLSSAGWSILGRLSATGRSRRRAGVN